MYTNFDWFSSAEKNWNTVAEWLPFGLVDNWTLSNPIPNFIGLMDNVDLVQVQMQLDLDWTSPIGPIPIVRIVLVIVYQSWLKCQDYVLYGIF